MHGTDERTAGRPVLGLLALFLAGATGCSRSAAEAVPVAQAPAAARVAVVKPARQKVERVVEQPGRVEAFERTPMYAKISGYVKAVNVEIGSRVNKGDVLAELAVPEMVEELKQKKGLVAQARLEIGQAEQALRVAGAAVQTAVSRINEAQSGRKRADANYQRWRSEFDRLDSLAADRVIDAQSRDEARNQLRAAEAARDEAASRVLSAEAAHSESEARRDKAAADLEVARKRLEVARADQRRTAALLGYARIVAPYDGVVAERHVDTGHLLRPEHSGEGTPLFVVVRMDKVRVFVEVPEADAVLVGKGTLGTIRVPVLNDREFEGKVAGTSWSLERDQRTLRAEIDFPNPDGLLRPAMYVHAAIRADRSAAWTLPSSAVLIRDGETFAYAAENGKAVRVPLRIGTRAGDRVEVFKKQVPARKPGERPRWVGLTGEEPIILRPAELSDGQEVVVGTGG